MLVSFHYFPTHWPLSPKSWKHLFPHELNKLDYVRALKRGIKSCGDKTINAPKGRYISSDVTVLWGWKGAEIMEDAKSDGCQVLIMERGYIPSRTEWTSLAFNGLNRRGEFGPTGDTGERWRKNYSQWLKPWKHGGDYVLLVGQVPGDMAMRGLDVEEWAQEKATQLRSVGKSVIYRPHPLANTACPAGAILSHGTLAEDFSKAECVVCFSSNTAVEAALAGIPVVVEDEGSMAYPMASHSVFEPLIRPDREDWCCHLAWCQWSLEEMNNGAAWQHIRKVIN